MKRLGEVLLDRGAIAVSELHTALEACHRWGGRLGTQLLRYGFVEEKALLEALSEQYGVPYVPESVLNRAPKDVAREISRDVLQRLQAIPFDLVQGRVQVAMINPRDAAALEELAGVAERPVEPFVATEAAVLKALEALTLELSGIGFEVDRNALGAGGEAWSALWQPPQVKPGRLLGFNPKRPESLAQPLLASFPGLRPLVDSVMATGDDLLDEQGYLRELPAAEHRDHVGSAILRFAASYLPRVCLFTVHKEQVVGWMARGPAVVLDDVQSLSIPLANPSIFSILWKTDAPFAGPVLPGPANEAILKAMGDPMPLEVVALPLRVKDRPVAFMLGDVPGEQATAVPLEVLMSAANRAGVAFEILIMKKKLQV